MRHQIIPAFFLFAAFAMPTLAHAEARELRCTYDPNGQDGAPYYGEHLKLILDGDTASLVFRGADEGDVGHLSASANRYYRLRYWGFQNHADCARGNYMDADRAIAEGRPGRIEFSGPGGANCKVSHDFYDCE